MRRKLANKNNTDNWNRVINQAKFHETIKRTSKSNDMNILFYKSQLQVPVCNKFALCAKAISCRKITDDVLKFKSAFKQFFKYKV